MVETILVRRNGAMGDVIMMTPVVARLRHQLGPDAIIDVNTFSSDVFLHNPHVSGVNVPPPSSGYHREINLELAYERRSDVHAIDAYMLEAFSDTHWPDKQVWLYRDRIDHLAHFPWDRAVALHAAVNTESRTFPVAFWESVIDLLCGLGYLPVILGASIDRSWPERSDVLDLTRTLSIHQVAAVIDRCRCFVTGDTGLSHVAAATLTPIVGIYTMARAEHRLPWRRGVFGWRCISLMPDLDCVGCFRTMWNLRNCNRGDFACVGEKMVAPQAVIEAVVQLAGPPGRSERPFAPRPAGTNGDGRGVPSWRIGTEAPAVH